MLNQRAEIPGSVLLAAGPSLAVGVACAVAIAVLKELETAIIHRAYRIVENVPA